MSELSKSGLVTKFNDSSTGLFKDAQAIPISNLRSFVTDYSDSSPLFEDLQGITLNTSDHIAFTGGASHTLTNYATQSRLWLFYFTDTNSGDVTINIDGVGAKALKKIKRGAISDMDPGDIVVHTIILCYFDSANDYFVCSGPWDETFRTITNNTNQVANSGTSETDLHTFTIPANTLDGSSRTLQGKYVGLFADASANYRIRLYIGGNVIYDSGTVTISGPGSWELNFMLITNGSGTAKVTASLMANNYSSTSPNQVVVMYTNLSCTWSSSNILKVTGQAGGGGGGSNDITCEMSQITMQR